MTAQVGRHDAVEMVVVAEVVMMAAAVTGAAVSAVIENRERDMNNKFGFIAASCRFL